MSEVKSRARLAKVIYMVDGDEGRDPLRVVLNQGSNDGIKIGDRFIVFGIGPHLSDPDTGADLGALEIVRGQGKIVHVQEHMATLRSTERRRVQPSRRVINDPSQLRALGAMPMLQALTEIQHNLIEEGAPFDIEIPFESVQLGDFAKPF